MKYLLILSMIVCNACYGQIWDTVIAEREKDTVLVFAMVTDTTHEFIEPYGTDSVSYNGDTTSFVFWVKGEKSKAIDLGLTEKAKTYGTYLYSVREIHNEQKVQMLDLYFDHKLPPNDYGVHLYYLDKDKQKLSPSIVVWQSIEVK